ncbi:MAG TPA: hypothetical protein PKZ76_01675 [Xanthomonadaceae bacterium]|nr:hypothetical protein [Xanthomonadaceae bacterium]
MRPLAAVSLLCLLAGCAGTPRMSGPEDAPWVAPAGDAPWHGGRMHLIREYTELYKEGGEDHRRQVQHLWDYSRGVAVRRLLSLDGEELLREDEPTRALRGTDEEQAIAFRRVREHPQLAASAAVPGAEWFGGFAYREPDDPYCDLGSRCIHVMVTVDGGVRRIIHAIVDLQSDRVVHPFFDPALARPVTAEDPHVPEAS